MQYDVQIRIVKDTRTGVNLPDEDPEFPFKLEAELMSSNHMVLAQQGFAAPIVELTVLGRDKDALGRYITRNGIRNRQSLISLIVSADGVVLEQLPEQ